MILTNCTLLRSRCSAIFAFSRRLRCSEGAQSCQGKEEYDTGIAVYDPVTRNKVPLTLDTERVAKWYSCGPTVYDSSHIGHAFSYVRMDIIRRILSNFFGVNVVLVMGVTDIDDKIIHRAQQQNITADTLAHRYEEEFRDDMHRLRVLPPTLWTRVSEHVQAVVSFCETLEQKGIAYTAPDGSLYFDVSKRPEYGVFRNAQDDSGTPVEGKRNPRDFALWKAAKSGEPSWESPWSRGRPGWHIECSAMASAIFGSAIDIHSGGRDLAFPHHENELAQSCSYHGVRNWVRHWLHTGQVQVRDASGATVKMSKSLGNSVLLRELLRSHSVDTFRMFCLKSPYRADVTLGPRSLQEAHDSLKGLSNFYADAAAYAKGHLIGGSLSEVDLLRRLSQTRMQIHQALADDFAYHHAVSSVLSLASHVNGQLQSRPQPGATTARGAVAACLIFVSDFFSKLGLELGSQGVSSMQPQTQVLDGVVDFRSKVRQQALALKDASLLQACDSLRDQLLRAGVQVKDRGAHSTWSLLPGKGDKD